MEGTCIQTNYLRFKKCKAFRYKLVIQDSKGAQDLHTNQWFKIEKVQKIYIETSHLRFKRWKGFTYKLVIRDSKDAKDLHTN